MLKLLNKESLQTNTTLSIFIQGNILFLYNTSKYLSFFLYIKHGISIKYLYNEAKCREILVVLYGLYKCSI